MEEIVKALEEKGVSEVLEREVKPYGTGAHISLNKKYLGKKVVILIRR